MDGTLSGPGDGTSQFLLVYTLVIPKVTISILAMSAWL